MNKIIKLGFICVALISNNTYAMASGSVIGKASWYSSGSKTANGERFIPDGLTAAHRTLPFGTQVRVEYVGTGKSVMVRINDRGPFTGNRIIDLSRGAAKKIGLINAGVGLIKMKVVK